MAVPDAQQRIRTYADAIETIRLATQYVLSARGGDLVRDPRNVRLLLNAIDDVTRMLRLDASSRYSPRGRREVRAALDELQEPVKTPGLKATIAADGPLAGSLHEPRELSKPLSANDQARLGLLGETLRGVVVRTKGVIPSPTDYSRVHQLATSGKRVGDMLANLSEREAPQNAVALLTVDPVLTETLFHLAADLAPFGTAITQSYAPFPKVIAEAYRQVEADLQVPASTRVGGRSSGQSSGERVNPSASAAQTFT